MMEIEYPDEIVFAYNPLYVKVSVQNANTTQVQVRLSNDERWINASLFNQQAQVYYSRLLQLGFSSPKHDRCRQVSMVINAVINGLPVEVFTFTHTVLWGSLQMGERFAQQGAFIWEDGKPYMERNVVWFKNYPFTLTLFSQGDATDQLQTRFDDAGYSRDTDIFSPKIDMVLSSLDESGYGSESNVSTGALKGVQMIVYSKQSGRFYGIRPGYPAATQWLENTGKGVRDSSFYNDKGGRVKTGIRFGCLSDHRFYQYNPASERLEMYPVGHYGVSGLFEVDPSITFPYAVKSARYRHDAGSVHIFDRTFDFTFVRPVDANTTLINLRVDNSKDGFYLRWVDRQGFIQYFLFTKGKQTLKNTLSKDVISDEREVAGMLFPNHTRITYVDATRTVKCGVSGLTKEIYDCVQSIATSPLIDLFLGRDKGGMEIWEPVVIASASYDWQADRQLGDIEITFTRPAVKAQRL